MMKNWLSVDRTALKRACRKLTRSESRGLLAVIGDDLDGLSAAGDVSHQFFESQGFFVARVYAATETSQSVKVQLVDAWSALEPESDSLEIPASIAQGKALSISEIIFQIVSLVTHNHNKKVAFIFEGIDALGALVPGQLDNYVQLHRKCRVPTVLISRKDSGTKFNYPFEKLILGPMQLDEVLEHLEISEDFRNMHGVVLEELVKEINECAIDEQLIAQDVYEILEEKLDVQC